MMQVPEPLALVLPLARATGLAPYNTIQDLRLSRLALLYSFLLHFALSMVSLYLVSLDDTYNLGYKGIIWLVNMVVLEIIIWTSVIGGPKNLRDITFVLTRVKKICRAVKFGDTKDVAQRKYQWVFIVMMFVHLFGLMIGVTQKNLVKDLIQFDNIANQAVFYNIKRTVLLFLTMQFVSLATKVTAALRGVNRGLQQLYTELCPRGDLDKYDANHFSYTKDILHGVGFINVKPKLVATFDHVSAPRRLRSLACAYVSTCDVARRLNDAVELRLFLLLTFSILNLMQEIFFALKSTEWRSISNIPFLLSSGNSALNGLLYIIELILLVAPCHDFSEELENTRYLVSHLSCEAPGCGDGFRAELDVFFIHLSANQPAYTALGVYTFRRPLLFTVATFVITYLAVLLGI